MAVISNFRATSVWKAFILNSVIAAIVILIAMTMKSKLDTYDGGKKPGTGLKSVSITLVVTFLASFLTYTFMYFMFGFGGGMLA